MQNLKDLYGQPMQRDWKAKRLFSTYIQVPLIPNAHKNFFSNNSNLKIHVQVYS